MAENYRFDFEKSRATLRKMLLERLPDGGEFPTPIDGLTLHRYNGVDMAKPHFYDPMLIIAVQGKKWVRIGMKDVSFGENNCFIAGVNMPVTSCLLEATENIPYLSMSLKLDRGLLSTLAAKIPPSVDGTGNSAIGAAVQQISPELLDAFLRMLELLDTPEQAQELGALIRQEVHYRLLTTPFGNQLRLLNTMGSQSNQINRAILWLRENYKESLRVEELAGKLNMAPSTFHKHFKEVTTISPLQYQKRLRLGEAQRLMLAANYDVTQAAFAVGYESANQFSREYKRLFGEPPRKDVMKMKVATAKGT